MGFVKQMRRANSALVDAFEKSKKRQQVEKKRMKQELVSYMNKVHQGSSIPTNDVSPARLLCVPVCFHCLFVFLLLFGV